MWPKGEIVTGTDYNYTRESSITPTTRAEIDYWGNEATTIDDTDKIICSLLYMDF